MTNQRRETVGGTQALDRALGVIFALAEAERPLSVPEIAERVGVPQSTTYRLIQSLEQRGLLQRRGPNRISLGLRILDLSRVVFHQLERDLLQRAHPIMAELARVTGEATVLMGRVGMHAISLDSVDSPNTLVRMAFESGRVLPLHLGASNKSLLAFLPETVIEEVIAMACRETPSLLSERLRQDLATIRAQGYAVTTGELDPEATGIGAPVLDAHGHAVASLSVAGPNGRLEPRVAEVIPLVVAAARRLSAQLAWVEL